MDSLTQRYRDKAALLEREALWFARYYTDAPFAATADHQAATGAGGAAWEPHVQAIQEALGLRAWPWEPGA